MIFCKFHYVIVQLLELVLRSIMEYEIRDLGCIFKYIWKV